LQQLLEDQVSQPRFSAALWGVKIVSLDTGRTVFEHNPQKLFSPASNSKLYTVALAFDRLGADYQIKTSLYAKTKPNRAGVLDGDLVVYGRGDPTITARLHGGEISKALEPLVVALTNAGVKRIRGGLVGDESFFHGPPWGSGWVWEDLEFSYGAPISALSINDNTLLMTLKPGPRVGAPCRVELSPPTVYERFDNRTTTVAKGAPRRLHFYRPANQSVVYVSGQMPIDDTGTSQEVPAHNPAMLFITCFKEALARHGIHVSSKLKTANWLDRQEDLLNCSNLTELGAVESPPMRDLAREVEKPSQNLYADLMLAQVGENERAANAGPTSAPGETSESLGIRDLNLFLAEAGVKKGDVLFEEGSGLSRDNLTTPNATVALLQHMSRHKCAADYLDALPIAGVDGTLKNRMKGTAAAGDVRAKTGTLRWANSLSGYVTTAAGEHLAFSLMLNRYHNTDPDHSSRADLDAIAILLASFTGRTQAQ